MSEQKVINSWDELLAADDMDHAEVPFGNGYVARLGSLSALEMLKWTEDQREEANKEANGLLLVAMCLVDQDGKRCGNVEDMKRLREKNPKTMQLLIQAAVTLNGMHATVKEKNDSSAATPSALPTVSDATPAA